MRWYLFLIGSSVGKKILMAVSGLCLTVFLAVHLLGNTTAFGGAHAFNNYAEKLHSLEPFLTLFNVGLLAIGIVHIIVGLILFLENRTARPVRYKIYENPGGRTIASDSMPYTGILILFFVIAHLMKFTFVDKSETAIYQLMAATFSNPLWVVLYVLAVIVVAVHISHGFWSLFQTVGLNHSRYMPAIMKLGMVIALIFGMGFGVVPIYLFIIT